MQETTGSGSGFQFGYVGPFAGIYTPYSVILETGTNQLARIEVPTVGAAYRMGSIDNKLSSGSNTSKAKVEVTYGGVGYAHPLGNGVVLGASYSTISAKSKANDDSKTSFSGSALMLKGIASFQNGLGIGVALVDTNETYKIGASIDEHYGYLAPTLVYSNSSLELAFTTQASRRHTTSEDAGFYKLEGELNLSEG